MPTQLEVVVENKAGSLERVTRLLASKGVNLTAINGEGLGSSGVVRFLTDNGSKAQSALKAAGYQVNSAEAFKVALPNKAGALDRLLRKLSAKGVNLKAVYGTACACAPSCDCACEIVIVAENPKLAKECL